MFKKLDYKRYDTYESWLSLYFDNDLYYYDPDVGDYVEIRRTAILKMIWEYRNFDIFRYH